MNLPRRRFLHLAACTAGLSAVSRIARAQTYPSRPVTMIVPAAAGGATDTIGRVLTERMKSSLGQPVIVEDVTGAGGIIGVGQVARAAPDGYTLSIGNVATHALNGATYALKYDVLDDFEPVSPVVNQPFVIVAKKTMPADDLKGLIAWLKVNPGKASAGSAGVGSMAHIGGILLQNATGTRFQHVPYRGTAPAMQDLMAGQIDLMIADLVTALPQVRAGTIKAYAVTAKTRLAAAPEIPTVDEAGVEGLYVSFWTGLWAPKGTPKDIIAKVNGAIIDALGDDKVRSRLSEFGQETFPRDQLSPAALRTLQRAEIEKWWPIIKAAGIKL